MEDEASADLLLQEIETRYPQFVAQLSGPWGNPDGSDIEDAWICNFLDRRHGHRTVHPGSSGGSPTEALQEGLKYLAAAIDNRQA